MLAHGQGNGLSGKPIWVIGGGTGRVLTYLASKDFNRRGRGELPPKSQRRMESNAFCYACQVSRMHAWRMHNSAWMLVLLSAGLQIVIFPLPDLYFLGWAAIAPLLAALLRAREPDTLQLRAGVKLLP